MRFASGLSVTLLSLVLSLVAARAENSKPGVEKLYILNCGEGVAGDISRWSPGVNEGKSMDFVDNCYLIKHAQGWFLWDTGIPDEVATMPNGHILVFNRGPKPLMEFDAQGTLVRAFGINVPRMITLTYGLGVGLAALAGVLSAPINQVRPLMGADLIIVVFAVVVIGGMGSIMGSIITGFALGVIEGLTKYFYPEASNTVVFVLMVLVLLVKPTGLTGRAA